MNKFLDVEDHVVALIETASSGGEQMSFEHLAASRKAVSPGTRIEPYDQDQGESCACHVAYPDLRGAKTRFKFK